MLSKNEFLLETCQQGSKQNSRSEPSKPPFTKTNLQINLKLEWYNLKTLIFTLYQCQLNRFHTFRISVAIKEVRQNSKVSVP